MSTFGDRHVRGHDPRGIVLAGLERGQLVLVRGPREVQALPLVHGVQLGRH